MGAEILIIEKNPEIRDLLTFFFEGKYNSSPEIFSDIENGIDALKTSSYDIILADYDAEKLNEANIKEYIESKEIKIPYFLISSLNLSSMPLFKSKTIQGLVNKNKLFESLEHCLEPFIQKIDQKNQNKFCKITLRCLTHLENINEDFFIQLKSGRYLKLFSKGDNVSAADVNKYREKGVDKLFIEWESIEYIIKKFDEVMPQIIEQIQEISGVDVNDENQYSSSLDKESQTSIDVTNLDNQLQEIINEKVRKTIDSIKKNPSLSKFLKNIKLDRSPEGYIANHVNLLCNVTVGIAKLMEWCTEATMEKLVFASITHDLTLGDKHQYAQVQTMEEIEKKIPKFTPKEVSFIVSHPLKVAEIIRNFGEKNAAVPPGIDVILEQHHERPDGKGFPRKLKGARITPLSALFIVAHDLTSYIMENPDWNIKKYLDKAKKEFHGGNFSKVILAVSKINPTL